MDDRTPEEKAEYERENTLRENWQKRSREITTPEQLADFAKELSEYNHDYSSCVLATGALALAGARLMSKVLGITGWQAGAAQWEFVEAWNYFEKGPKRMLTFANLLYPQYSDKFEKTITKSTAEWLKTEAQKLLDERGGDMVHPDVLAHWKSVAAGKIPFGFTVEED